MWDSKLLLVLGILLATFAPLAFAEASISNAEMVDAAKRYALSANLDSVQRPAMFFYALKAQRDYGLDVSRIALGEFVLRRSPYSEDSRFNDNALLMLNRIEPYIWNGDDANDGQFAEAVGLYGPDGICSGVVVGSYTVLTAAHCVCKGRASRVVIGSSLNRRVETINVSAQTLMPPSCFDDRRGRDLALLTLHAQASPLPVRFADYVRLGDMTHATVVGFGRAENNRPSGVKRFAQVVVVSKNCTGASGRDGIQLSDQARFDCVPVQELVAGSPVWLADSCGGDSGGPLYDEMSDDRQLVAITSRGVKHRRERPCGDGGIYTRLDHNAKTWLSAQGIF